MRSIFLSGRLTGDPEVKTVTDKELKVAMFTLANSDRNKDSAEYFDVECWDNTAVFAENYLKKGQKVVVQGSFENETYKDKGGNVRHHFKIKAHAIEFAS